MSDIREMLVDTTAKVMKNLCTKDLINEVEQGAWADELWKTLEESGMTTVGAPEESGGSGGTIGDALHMIRVAGEFAAPVPLAETLMANWILADSGLSVLTGPLAIAPIHADDHVKYDRTSDGWLISGIARSVPWARTADKLIVVGESQQGMMTAVVDPKHCAIENGQNLAGEPRDDVTFDQVQIGENAVAPTGPMASKIGLTGAMVRTVMIAGSLQRLLDLAVTYSKERTQFGRSIGRFQAVQQQLAVLAGEATAAQIAASAAIEAFEGGEGEEAIMSAKIRGGEAASTSAPIAHQVHGAIGFTDEHALHQTTRRLWAWRDEFGSESYWAERLGQKVIDKESGHLWPFLTRI